MILNQPEDFGLFIGRDACAQIGEDLCKSVEASVIHRWPDLHINDACHRFLNYCTANGIIIV